MDDENASGRTIRVLKSRAEEWPDWLDSVVALRSFSDSEQIGLNTDTGGINIEVIEKAGGGLSGIPRVIVNPKVSDAQIFRRIMAVAEKVHGRLSGKPKWSKFKSRKSRRDKLFERHFGSVERVSWMSDLPCATCGRPPISECSHYPSRGAGGGPDDMFPQCFHCHQEMHRVGVKTFQRERNVVLRELTRMYAKMWQDDVS